MAIAQNFPEIAPSLDLSFALTKALDSRVTFSRASTATYYGTETAKAEENLLIRSQEFQVGWGAFFSSVTADTSTAPDGTVTADTLKEDSVTEFHRLVQSVSTSGTITVSVFAKLGAGTRFLTIGADSSGTDFGSATFDLSAGTLTQTQANGAYTSSSGTITLVAQSFYRCTLTVTTNTATSVRIGLNSTGTPTAAGRGFGAIYAGDDTSSIILWGAQLEQRSAVTAYTPTTTQPITNYIPVLETASAGVARFDHNPLTFESLGLLVEEQRTNLLTYSEDFSDSDWVKRLGTGIRANQVIAPDGTLTGTSVFDNASSTGTFIRRTITLADNTIHTATVYVKKQNAAAIRLTCFAQSSVNDNVYININFDTEEFETVINGAIANASANAVKVGNGWWRLQVTFNSASGATAIPFNLGFPNSASGNGEAAFFAWGAQLEAGAFPTSYIPTVASQVTRSADSASMTGANFSSWYRADEGTIYAEGSTPQDAIIPFLSISDGSNNNRIQQFNWSNVQGQIISGNVIQAQFDNGTIPSSLKSKIVLAYKVNDSALSLNGATPAVDTVCIMPTGVNRLSIGGNASGTTSSSRTIRKLAFYQKRLTNAQLQAITG